MKRQQPPNAHDKCFKSVFGRPAVAADFLRRYLPSSIVRLLDLTQIELKKDSFIDAKLRQHFSDLLYRVGLAGGGEAYLYFRLEHKSEPDKWVGLQLLRYPGAGLGTDAARRRRKTAADHPGSLLSRGGALGGGRAVPRFKHLCDLSQYADEELEGAGDLAPSLRLLKHIFDNDLSLRLSGFFRLVIERMPPSIGWRRRLKRPSP